MPVSVSAGVSASASVASAAVFSSMNCVGLENPGTPWLAGKGEPYTKSPSTVALVGGRAVGRAEAVGTTTPVMSSVKDLGPQKPGIPWLAGTGDPYTKSPSSVGRAAIETIWARADPRTVLPTLKARGPSVA